MPSKRRAKSNNRKRETPAHPSVVANGQTNSALYSEMEGTPSSLSSLSTPASMGIRDPMANRDEDQPAVDQLLSRASEALQDKVNSSAAMEIDDNETSGTPTKRPRTSTMTPVGQTSGSSWYPGKVGRPPKKVTQQRRLAGNLSDTSSILNTPLRQSLRNRRPETPSSAAGEYDEFNDTHEGISSNENQMDDDAEQDPAGEAKIDADGYLQGGREFICPLFRSPFRENTRRQYVLSMDCCRYTGARDSYMMFKQHQNLQRIETTQQERDMLSDQNMIPRLTRFRPIAMVTARAAFKEFGAVLVKNGRYITDDYWETRCRNEAKHTEGTAVANMSVYHRQMEARTAGSTGAARQSGGEASLKPSTELPVESADGQPLYAKMRSAQVAESAFESVIALHRTEFSDDHRGFVDGIPLVKCIAQDSRNKLRRYGSQSNSHNEEDRILAASRQAREFNSSLRMWRQDNGCTWVDPHTGIRQVPSSSQPTRVWTERLVQNKPDVEYAVEQKVGFPPETIRQPNANNSRESYPLAIIPGQYQESFPVHRTRFGQSYQQTMQSYSYHWLRQSYINNNTNTNTSNKK